MVYIAKISFDKLLNKVQPTWFCVATSMQYMYNI